MIHLGYFKTNEFSALYDAVSIIHDVVMTANLYPYTG